MTMHKVQNYGSALQAFALQKKLMDLGYENEIIDYVYPNVEHLLYANPNGLPPKKNTLKSCIVPLIMYLQKWVKGIHRKDNCKKKLFETFYNDNFILSSKTYPTRLVLEAESPRYDIYLTGSDQVWNPKYIGYDTSFMFHFIKDNNPCVSYAASFSSKNIPENYQPYYKQELLKYKSISVREETGIAVVEKLVGKGAKLVCDPTLLLTKKEWKTLADKSSVKQKGKFILVYILDYAYDPYPNIYDRIEELEKELNLPIIVLSGRKEGILKKAKDVTWFGPYEFLNLFMNASFVITTSFHGTAFALNFDKPLCAVIKDRSDNDSRIYNLLRRVGRESLAVVYNEKINDVSLFLKQTSCKDCALLDKFRNESINYLKTALE